MLLVHFVLSIILETNYSRIPELWEENVVEHHDAWSINDFYSGDAHLATALEGWFVGNCDKQPQSDMVEESRVLEGCNLETMLQKECVNNNIFVLYCGVDSPFIGMTTHFLFILYIL